MRLLNVCKFPMRWSDMDAYKHLNHAIFFHFMTEARAELFRDVLKVPGASHFVVARIECDYRRSFHYPDNIILKQYCEKLGGSSFHLHYEFFSENHPDIIFAEGKTVMVACNPTTGRPVRIPAEVRTLLDPASS